MPRSNMQCSADPFFSEEPHPGGPEPDAPGEEEGEYPVQICQYEARDKGAMASAAAAVIPDSRRWSKGPGSSSSPVTTAIFLFFFVVVVGVLVSARWITTTVSSEFVFPLLPLRSELGCICIILGCSHVAVSARLHFLFFPCDLNLGCIFGSLFNCFAHLDGIIRRSNRTSVAVSL